GRGDIEGLGLLVACGLAVRVPGGREHDRAGWELDLAKLDLLEQDAAREGSDRLEPQDLFGRGRGERGVVAELSPLVDVVGEETNTVRELALRRVDAAVHHVE